MDPMTLRVLVVLVVTLLVVLPVAQQASAPCDAGHAAALKHAPRTERGGRTRHALAHALAQELFERDRRRVGYLAGIGIFRAWYLAGAERLLDEMNGRAILIDPPR